MSGTSLDGLDIAICRFQQFGKRVKHELVTFDAIPFSPELRMRLKKVCYQDQAKLEEITRLNVDLGQFIAESINAVLLMQNIKSEEVDLIASHGQTIYHAPDYEQLDDPQNATLQIGDGDVIAVQTGLPVLSDFRMREIGLGREGAPLAPYAEKLLVDEGQSVVLVNIGGISNITYFDERGDFLGTDCGPGNTLMDGFMMHISDGAISYDEDGWMAAKGTPSELLIKRFKQHDFFDRPYPKSTGQEDFDLIWLQECVEEVDPSLSDEEIMASLARFTTDAIIRAMHGITDEIPEQIYVSGGGSHNPVLMNQLSEGVKPSIVKPTDAIGMPVDAKEAILFAALGYHAIWGKRDDIPRLGKFSWPHG
jgi:anhydro-N-acetylmuramic acid kinase